MRCAELRTAGLIVGLTIGAGSTVAGQSGASRRRSTSTSPAASWPGQSR